MIRRLSRTSAPRFPARIAASFIALSILAGCTPTVSHRGYLPRSEDLQRLQVGMSKSEVEATLGSPSTTATIRTAGDSFYYISSVFEQQAFFDPQEVDRKVLAIRFDANDQVESFATYQLQDGEIININTRKTPTAGRELTVLQQIFANLGNLDPAEGAPSRGSIGQ
jgi:outer membrane protein assembly factor BamE (lipoprotein component of BamABCDE complex)